MFAPSYQQPTLRPFPILLSWLVLAIPLAIGACNSAESPLAPAEGTPIPTEETLAPATVPDPSEAVASGDPLAALTAPRIAFVSKPTGSSSDIYLTDPLGKTVTRLTTTTVLGETSPAWSWDNKRIALVRPRKDGSDNYHNDIYIINADGSNGHWARPFAAPWQLADPEWSPDGSRLVVSVFVQDAYYLAWIHLASGSVSFITSATGALKGTQPSYDPTGQKIIYIGASGRSLDQIKADGSMHTYLIGVSTTYLSHPTFAPDGKRIAFDKPVNGDQEIFVRNADGIVKRITTSAGLDNYPTWSPDGGTIAFTSKRSGQYQIWSKRLADGTLTRITRTTSLDGYPAYSH